MNKNDLLLNLSQADSLIPYILPHGAHWAIEETAAMQLLQLLKVTGAQQHIAESKAPPRDGYGENLYHLDNGIAMLKMSGPLTKSVSSLSAGTSTIEMRRAIRHAAANEEVKAILLIVDSPGGSVAGTDDLAQDVASAAKKKPVYAYAEDCCCSAAYWIASQASEFYASPTAIVGSIGTYMVVEDWSRMYENAGVAVHVLSTGKYKGAGIEGAKITNDQLAEFQSLVEDLNGHFLAGIAKGRNMTRAQVETLADGRVHVGEKAKALGLVDGIATIDQVVGSIRRDIKTGARAETQTETISRDELPLAGMTLAEESDAALAAVGGLISRLKDLKEDRQAEGRELSKKARGHITSLQESLETVGTELASLLKPAKAEDARPDSKLALSRAVRDAELMLAITR